MASTVDPFATPRGLKRKLELDVSARTIDRRLNEAGLYGRVAVNKRRLTDDDKRKRLSFASGYSGWTVQQWDRVLYSDEAVIEGEGSCSGRRWVRRAPSVIESLKSEHCTGKLPHPIKMNVWACFSGRGLGYCYIFNSNLDAKLLEHILDTHLIPSAALVFEQHPFEPWWLLQDNAPAHKSRSVQQWLHNHGIQLLDFPPYSPDLNPIEHLWADVETRVEQRAACTVEQLQERISEEWAATPVQLLESLSHSMPARCQAVIDARGDHTRF